MGLPKGRTNNPKGRRPGALNRMNKELRQTITDFLESRWPDIEQAFDLLSARDKVTFYRELLQYRLPKLESIALHELGLETLTDDQLDDLIIKLKDEHDKKK